MKKSEIIFNLASVAVDFFMIIIAFILAYYIRVGFENISVSFNEYIRWAILIAPCWTIIFFFGGLYFPEKEYRIFGKFYNIFLACSIGTLITVSIIFLRREFFFSRLVIVYIWILSFILVIIGRFFLEILQKFLFEYGYGTYKILIIGYNSKTKNLIKEIHFNKKLGYEIIGILNDEKKESDINFLGSIENLEEIYNEKLFDCIVQVEEDISLKKSLKLMNFCRANNLNFILMPNLLDIRLIHAKQTYLGKIPLIEIKSTPLDGLGGLEKRIIDFIISLFSIILLSPIFLLVAFLIKLTSKGPIFYKQERIGYNNKKFNVLKFRSMYAISSDGSAEISGQPQVTIPNDDRRTFIGKIIRKLSIDELPQLINILKGDMSLVGPRPERLFYIQKFSKKIPGYNLRHSVRPGLTGWAQANGLRGSTTSLEERIKFDIYYIENWSISFDFKIILKTFFIIFKGRGAY